jgi:hypothetical protein
MRFEPPVGGSLTFVRERRRFGVVGPANPSATALISRPGSSCERWPGRGAGKISDMPRNCTSRRRLKTRTKRMVEHVRCASGSVRMFKSHESRIGHREAPYLQAKCPAGWSTGGQDYSPEIDSRNLTRMESAKPAPMDQSSFSAKLRDPCDLALGA